MSDTTTTTDRKTARPVKQLEPIRTPSTTRPRGWDRWGVAVGSISGL
jgi:hypothetical protein